MLCAVALASVPACIGVVSDPIDAEDEEDGDRTVLATLAETKATCQGQAAAKVNAVLHSSVNEQTYRRFVGDINQFFARHGVPLTLTIARISRVETLPNRWDSQLSKDADFAMLVGPGWGGYVGPPYYNIAANSDWLWNLFHDEVAAEAHEILHHFGVPDYYTITREALDAEPTIGRDIMISADTANPALHPKTRRIVCFNLNRSRELGRGGIYYPVPEQVFGPEIRTRFAPTVKIKLRVLQPAPACQIYRMTYDWTNWVAGYESTPAATVNAFPGGAFTIGDIRQWFTGFKIECGGAQPYFVTSPALEDCFFGSTKMAAVTSCTVTCTTPGKWCSARPN